MTRFTKRSGGQVSYPIYRTVEGGVKVTFSKQIMSIPELMEMGWTRKDLESYYRRKGQRYAWRKNSKSNIRGHIVFDTELFGQAIEREKEIQAKVRERR